MYTDHNNDCYYNINYVYYNKKRFKNIWSSLYWPRRLFESSNSTFSNAMFHTQHLVSIENIKGAKISRKQCLIFIGLLVGWYLWGKIIIVVWSFVSWTAISISITIATTTASRPSSVCAITRSWKIRKTLQKIIQVTFLVNRFYYFTYVIYAHNTYFIDCTYHQT